MQGGFTIRAEYRGPLVFDGVPARDVFWRHANWFDSKPFTP